MWKYHMQIYYAYFPNEYPYLSFKIYFYSLFISLR